MINSHYVSDLSAWVGRDTEGDYRKSNRFGTGEVVARKDVGPMTEFSFMIPGDSVFDT